MKFFLSTTYLLNWIPTPRPDKGPDYYYLFLLTNDTNDIHESHIDQIDSNFLKSKYSYVDDHWSVMVFLDIIDKRIHLNGLQRTKNRLSI